MVSSGRLSSSLCLLLVDMEAQTSHVPLMLVLAQSFGQDVSCLVLGGDRNEDDVSLFNALRERGASAR